MKNSIYALLLMASASWSLSLPACKSPEAKIESAQEKVAEAREDLSEAKKEATEEIMKAASEEEWRVFKTETEYKIRETEKKIDELRAKMKSAGKKLDVEISNHIDNLEFKIKELKERVNNYEKTRTDYAAFKREFNHDIDQLGSALNDLVVNNKL